MTDKEFNLREFMNKHGLSDTAIATITEKSLSAVQSWKNGSRQMQSASIALLRRHVGEEVEAGGLSQLQFDVEKLKGDNKRLTELWQALVKELVSSDVLDKSFLSYAEINTDMFQSARGRMKGPLGNKAPHQKEKDQDEQKDIS